MSKYQGFALRCAHPSISFVLFRRIDRNRDNYDRLLHLFNATLQSNIFSTSDNGMLLRTTIEYHRRWDKYNNSRLLRYTAVRFQGVFICNSAFCQLDQYFESIGILQVHTLWPLLILKYDLDSDDFRQFSHWPLLGEHLNNVRFAYYNFHQWKM